MSKHDDQMRAAHDIITEWIRHMSIGTNLMQKDIIMVLVKKDIILTQNSLTELVKQLVDDGSLVRVTARTLMKPLPVSMMPKVDLNMEQRLAILEGQVKDLTTQVAGLSSRLI
jgi:polyhydroxyalkanoate synthesis regulator phasin